MMLPILISVSVAPMSYFFCANAAVELAARIASAAENNPNRTWIAGISISLIWFDCVDFFDWERLLAPRRIQYPPEIPGNKKPPAQPSRGALFSRRSPIEGARESEPPGACLMRALQALVAQIVGDDGAEQVPLLALEPHHLQLLDRGEVGRPGVDLDARQQRVGLEILQARRLLHDVLAREIVAALLQHLHQRLRDAVAVHHRAVEPVGVGVVFR